MKLLKEQKCHSLILNLPMNDAENINVKERGSKFVYVKIYYGASINQSIIDICQWKADHDERTFCTQKYLNALFFDSFFSRINLEIKLARTTSYFFADKDAYAQTFFAYDCSYLCLFLNL